MMIQKKAVTKDQHDYIEKLQKELSYLDSANVEMAETLQSFL